jgi:hypothetical protein
VTTEIVFETHAISTDNEAHLLKGAPLEVLVGAPFEWQEGWLYKLTGDAESTASRSEET